MCSTAPTPPATPRSTLSSDYQRDWPEYFDAVDGKPPRETVLKALDLFDREQLDLVPVDREPRPAGNGSLLAIDIACGEGRDSRAILDRGPRWSVWSLDYHAEAITRARAKLPAAQADRCHVLQIAMEDIASSEALPSRADLINASFALPFCKPEAFEGLWHWICRTLRPGGRFSGQFFGERDEWMCVRPKSHRTLAQVGELLEPFELEYFQEVLKEGDDATGKQKFHHVFHIVACRKSGA